MISRNKGILSLEFLVPNVGLIFAIVSVGLFYAKVVTPQAENWLIERDVRAAHAEGAPKEVTDRPYYVVIKDRGPKWEVAVCLLGLIVLGYKFYQLNAERRLLKHDFVKIQPGERIIPEDALDRYKEMKIAVDRQPQWRDRLLPECLLAALHRFHATSSV